MIASTRRAFAAWVLASLLTAGAAYGDIFPVDSLIVTGPLDKRINVVFLGDGYTAGEMGQFSTDVQNTLPLFFFTKPYHEYQSYFNVFAIEVPSNESGADHPATAADEPGGFPVQFRDTYFNSSYDVAGIHRLLVPDYEPVDAVLQDNFPAWDIVFVLVNQDWYGGSGGAFATMSTHSSSSQIAIHELGHSFAGLADEYETGGGSGFEAPNATAVVVRDSIKWNAWIDLSTPIPTPETGGFGGVVGLFQGAVYNSVGWYRPRLFCKMRELTSFYCEVCVEQAARSVYNVIRPIESTWLQAPDFTVYQDTVANLWIQNLLPSPNTLVVNWYVDGAPWASGVDTLPFDGSAFDTGSYLVEALVVDSTPMVRKDSLGLLRDSASWIMHVVPTPYQLGDVDASGVVSSADIIKLVNFIFKSGPPPFPWWAAGDLNCNGTITSGDIISLVNYVFKGAAQPVCP